MSFPKWLLAAPLKPLSGIHCSELHTVSPSPPPGTHSRPTFRYLHFVSIHLKRKCICGVLKVDFSFSCQAEIDDGITSSTNVYII